MHTTIYFYRHVFTCSRVLPDAIGSFCEQGVALSNARIDIERYNEKCGVVGLYNVEQVPSASDSQAIVCFYLQCKLRNVFETIAAQLSRAVPLGLFLWMP